MHYDIDNTEVTFSNYNASFMYFFEEYKAFCLNIAKERDIYAINRKLFNFIAEFNYALIDGVRRSTYIEKIKHLEHLMTNDSNLSQIRALINNAGSESTFNKEVQYYRLYYVYLFQHLELLSDFADDLTSTFMPHTNMQQKMIRYFNNKFFFDSFIEFKRNLINKINEFKITRFIDTFNMLIVFYHAYRLFVNDRIKHIVEQVFSIIYSMYTHDESLRILKQYPHIVGNNLTWIQGLQSDIIEQMLFANSQINISFSKYGILPKLNRKIYTDRTLI